MAHTRYTDPSGYDDATVSTAADQLRIVDRAMRITVFARVVASPSAWLPVAGAVRNTNTLLGRDGSSASRPAPTRQPAVVSRSARSARFTASARRSPGSFWANPAATASRLGSPPPTRWSPGSPATQGPASRVCLCPSKPRRLAPNRLEGIVMPHRWMNRSLLSFCVVAAVGMVATASAGAMTKALAAPQPSCDTQVNDTPSKLLPCIQKTDLWNHMQEFQAIAIANPGPATVIRRATPASPGYKASADYVATVMTARRLRRHDPAVHVPYYAFTAIADVQRGLADAARLLARRPTGVPGQSTGTATAPRSSRPAASSFRRRRRRARRAAAPRPTSRASSPAGSR